MTGRKIKIAFIGAGNMTRAHVQAFADIPQAELSGIYSRTVSKSEDISNEFKISEVCDSIADLYQRTQADLVVISVSELSVREICFEAFKYPWTCLIEKPAGYDLADAKIIAAEAARTESKAFVALNRRHYNSTRLALDELEGNGGQRLIQVVDQEDAIAATALGRPDLVVKNWMYANSIHLIDYFQVLGRGEIVSVEPIIKWNPDSPSFVAAKISFSSGDIGLYNATWNAPGPWSVTVSTQAKRLELRPLEQLTVQVNGSRQADQRPVNERDVRYKAGLRQQAEEAINAVMGKKHKLPDLNEAVKSMELVKAIYE